MSVHVSMIFLFRTNKFLPEHNVFLFMAHVVIVFSMKKRKEYKLFNLIKLKQ